MCLCAERPSWGNPIEMAIRRMAEPQPWTRNGPPISMGNIMKPTLLASASLATLIVGNSAFAQPVTDDGATVLPRLLVTAGRTPVEQEKSGRAFTVVTGEQLAQNQTRYVADALRQVPGVHVSRAGSFGGLTQVRMRGAEGNHVLVLIDGVEVSEVSGGEFDFGNLPVGDIDRIEVLRGPQSAFWGSNATAGVINIITKRGSRDGFAVDTRSEAGTDGTFLAGVSVRGGNERMDGAFSIDYRRTDGFNISDFGDEKDGDRNLTLSGRFTFDATDNLVIDASGRLMDRLSEFDSADFAFPATPTQGLLLDTDTEVSRLEFSGTIGATWTSLDGAWTHEARFAGNAGEREDFTDGARTSGNRGDRIKASWQSTFLFETPAFADAVHTITAGYEWEQERYRAIAPVFDPSQLETQERSAHSLVAEYRGEFADQIYLNGAIRHDLNDDFADATTYSVAAAWAIPGTGTRLHASAGTGVTNPTFFEQFGFTPARFIGNPDLVPEESFGWDIGVEQSFFDGALVVDLTYFNQDLRNEITTQFPGPDFIGTPVNLDGTSKRQGIEVAATAELFDGFTTTIAYTYTDSTDPDGMREVRRPQHTASLNAGYAFLDDRARVFGELIYNGRVDDLEFINATPETRVVLDDYVVVNIGGSFDISENFEAYGRIENLFDADYEEIFGYNSQGRTAFVGIKARF